MTCTYDSHSTANSWARNNERGGIFTEARKLAIKVLVKELCV